MNRPKLTKKELAARADRFEEQLDRLKNRLNRYSYKKTKQGNRLDLLWENTRMLDRRLTHLADDDGMPIQGKKLLKQVRTLKEAVGKLQTGEDAESTALTTGLKALQQKQQRLKADLRRMRKVVNRVSDGNDDLQSDSSGLSAHVRDLEESSSKLSVHQAAHDGRIRDLEETFAESSRQQERHQREKNEQERSQSDAIGKNIDSLQSELMLMHGQFSDGHEQHKDLERTIEQLSNRISELGEQLTARQSELEHRLQSGEQQAEGIERRLPELESRLESLQTAHEQDSGAIDVLELGLEESRRLGQEVERQQPALSERLEQGLDRSDTAVSQLQGELKQALLQQQHLEQQIATQGTDGERRDQQLDALAETTRSHAERLDSLGTALEASDTGATAREQRTSEWMARLGAIQSTAAKQLVALETSTGGHDDNISQLKTGLERANDSSSNQQQRIEAAHTRGFRHTMAITALLIIGLLGGIALYQFLTQKIVGIKRDVALSLTQQGEQYALHNQTDAQYRRLESALAATRRQLETLSADTTASLGEADAASGTAAVAEMVSHPSRLEQRLAHNEARIGNLLALMANQGPVIPAPNAFPPLQEAVTRMEQEIATLKTGVKRLQSSTQPDGALRQQRIAALELSLSQAKGALEQRLQQVEGGQAKGLEQQQQLTDRIDTLTGSMTALKQAVRHSSLPGQTVRWQQAVEIGQYSIQLLGMHNLKALLAFAEHHPLEGERAYARTTYQGRDWYILLYGMFNGVRDARSTLDALPDPIKGIDPWIRELTPGLSFTSIP